MTKPKKRPRAGGRAHAKRDTEAQQIIRRLVYIEGAIMHLTDAINGLTKASRESREWIVCELQKSMPMTAAEVARRVADFKAGRT